MSLYNSSDDGHPRLVQVGPFFTLFARSVPFKLAQLSSLNSLLRFSWNKSLASSLRAYRRAMSSETSCDEIIAERKGDKGVITLNRPNQLNALNLPMIRSLYTQLRKWETDNTMKMVIIKGAGDKSFCSGGDVKG